MCFGDHVVKTWSVTQATVALSSAEAEYNADVKASSIGLGFVSLLGDLGVSDIKLSVHTDSSAAIGIANRTGLGKVRHLAVHLLWLQEKVRSGEVCLTKIVGSINPADLMTKHVSGECLVRHSSALKLAFPMGRPIAAPQALLSS